MERRRFLKGSAAAAATASAATSAAGAASGDGNDNVLVYIFLRGGADGLHITPPIDGPDRARYVAYRPNLQVPTSGAGAALPLASLGGTAFGLHPAAAPLKELFDDGHLAVVQAIGTPDTTSSRSHFDAMAYIELGTPGLVSTASGWLTRHMASAPNLPPDLVLPVLAVNTTPPTSLLGDRSVLTMVNPDAFDLGYAHWKWDDPSATAVDRASTMRAIYQGDGFLESAGRQALTAADIVGEVDFSAGPSYPDSAIAGGLKTVAQLIKRDVGLRVATLDVGGWDTHTDQDANNFFADQLLGPVAQGLAAFFNDMENGGQSDKITLVLHSEFGRRVYENADQGTDHGTGNAMLLLGRTVNGGKLYGQWPGLAAEALFAGEDLAATTDFRQVLSELLQNQLQNDNIDTVFPRFTPGVALNLFKGAGASGNRLFDSGFE